MNDLLKEFFIILFLAIMGWVLLGRIKYYKPRIILRSGFLSLILSPTFYFDDKYIVFGQAWNVMMTMFTCGRNIKYFFIGLIPILILWLIGTLIGFSYYKNKQKQEVPS